MQFVMAYVDGGDLVSTLLVLLSTIVKQNECEQSSDFQSHNFDSCLVLKSSMICPPQLSANKEKIKIECIEWVKLCCHIWQACLPFFSSPCHSLLNPSLKAQANEPLIHWMNTIWSFNVMLENLIDGDVWEGWSDERTCWFHIYWGIMAKVKCNSIFLYSS